MIHHAPIPSQAAASALSTHLYAVRGCGERLDMKLSTRLVLHRDLLKHKLKGIIPVLKCLYKGIIYLPQNSPFLSVQVNDSWQIYRVVQPTPCLMLEHLHHPKKKAGVCMWSLSMPTPAPCNFNLLSLPLGDILYKGNDSIYVWLWWLAFVT